MRRPCRYSQTPSPLAGWFLHFALPAQTYRAYWPIEDITKIYLADPSPEQVRQVARCQQLERLELTIRPHFIPLKPDDFAGFETMRHLQVVSVMGPQVAPGILDRVFQVKPDLIEATLVVPQTPGAGDGVLASIGRQAPRGLFRLWVENSGVTDKGLTALQTCKSLSLLTLRNIQSQGPGLEALKNLNNLSQLEISFNSPQGWTPRNMDAVGQITSLESLTLFTSNGPQKIPGTYKGLAHLTNLTHLDVDLGDLPDADLAFLIPMKHLQTLRLGIRRCNGSGLDPTLSGKTSITSLTLYGGEVLSDANLKFLSTLTALETLELSFCQGYSGDFLQYLPTSGALKTVRFAGSTVQRLPNFDHARILSLDFIASERFNVDSMENIAHHPTLRTLNIHASGPIDACCKYLAQMPALQSLIIDNITAQGAQTLVTSKSLRRLVIKDNKISANDKAKIRKINPAITIY